ncbi:hypothetical protein L0337_01875 [candidate division KSB1 bacterium]|nr:hypothetical protein [candidate division KSB1 bacterium]
MIKLKPKIVHRGFQIYNKLKRALEAEHYREYVAIEVKSGEYFLGRTMDEALNLAERKYPKAKFFVVRIGDLATISFKNRFSL